MNDEQKEELIKIISNGVEFKHKALKDKRVLIIQDNLFINNNNRLLKEVFPEMISMSYKIKKEVYPELLNDYDYMIVFPESKYIDIHNLNDLQYQICLHEMGHILNRDLDSTSISPASINGISIVSNNRMEIEADKYLTNKRSFSKLLIGVDSFVRDKDERKSNKIRYKALHINLLSTFIDVVKTNVKLGFRIRLYITKQKKIHKEMG